MAATNIPSPDQFGDQIPKMNDNSIPYYSFQNDQNHAAASPHNQAPKTHATSRKDADNLVGYYSDNGSRSILILILCLLVTLGLMWIAFIFYCMHFSQDLVVDHEDWTMTYMNISDFMVVVYEITIIVLCGIFIKRYYRGEIIVGNTYTPLANRNDIATIELSQKRNVVYRSRANHNFCELLADLLKNLDLNQYTIAAMFCATHHAYASILLLVAAINSKTYWYIVTACVYGLGAISIPFPVLCFQSHIKLCEKEKNLANPSKTNFTRIESFRHTIFSNEIVTAIVFFGFFGLFCQFITIPILKSKDIIYFFNLMYNCEGELKCQENGDFLVNEIIFRGFVGMTIVNNMVLLASGVGKHTVVSSGLSDIRTILHPLVYPFLFVVLMVEIRFGISNSSSFATNLSWSAIFVYLVLIGMCCYVISKLWTINYKLFDTYIKRTMVDHLNMVTVAEGIVICIIAFFSWVFMWGAQGMDVNIARRMVLWLFLAFQIGVLCLANKIQSVAGFSKEISNEIKWCFIFFCITNLHGFLYSFVFDTMEFVIWINSNHDNYDDIYYRIAFGLSFTFAHLLMWSLALCIEFLIGLDNDNKLQTPHNGNVNDDDNDNDNGNDDNDDNDDNNNDDDGDDDDDDDDGSAIHEVD